MSRLADEDGRVYGLTYRVGRHVPGLARIFADVLHAAAAPLLPRGAQQGAPQLGHGPSSVAAAPPCSLLLVGPPGAGKTDLLR